MNTVNIGPYSINIHDNAGINCSGGADSGILLYILMKYSTSPLNIYSLASKEKLRSVSHSSANVIAKCMDLTNTPVVFHHISYVDSQNTETLYQQPKEAVASGKIKILYSGLTQLPPEDVYLGFKDKLNDFIINWRTGKRDLYIENGKVYRPLANYNKQDIKNLYDILGLTDTLFPLTRSCESLTQSTGHCGECWWCEERQWAFGRLE